MEGLEPVENHAHEDGLRVPEREHVLAVWLLGNWKSKGVRANQSH